VDCPALAGRRCRTTRLALAAALALAASQVFAQGAYPSRRERYDKRVSSVGIRQ
jgi:hypothetical protein